VIDAHEVRRKAHRPEQKSDTRDAQELCEGVRRGFYRSVVHVPSPEIEELRTALSRRRRFIRLQTAEVNAVKRLLRGVGRDSGRRGSLRTEALWQRLLAADIVPAELKLHVQDHYALWREAAERVRALDLRLGEHARKHRAEIKQLETVPVEAGALCTAGASCTGPAVRAMGSLLLRVRESCGRSQGIVTFSAQPKTQ
jgi:transposase